MLHWFHIMIYYIMNLMYLPTTCTVYCMVAQSETENDPLVSTTSNRKETKMVWINIVLTLFRALMYLTLTTALQCVLKFLKLLFDLALYTHSTSACTIVRIIGWYIHIFRYWMFLKDDSENACDKVSLIFILKQDVDDISCQVCKWWSQLRSACILMWKQLILKPQQLLKVWLY